MFSRRVQDFIVVTVMTVLIWLYAEGANVQTYTPADTIRLDVRLNAPDLVIIGQEPQRVSISFKGAQAELAKLRQELKGTLSLTLDISEPGPKSLPLADVIRDAKPLDLVSVNVTRVEPATLELVVDRLEQREAQVVFRTNEAPVQAVSVEVEPATVMITAPSSLFDRLGNQAVTVEAQATDDLKLLPPRGEHRVKSKLVMPSALAGLHSSLSAAEANVRFWIATAEETATLTNVPVWVSVPPQTEYEIVLVDRSLRDVKVTGPAEAIRNWGPDYEQAPRIIAELRLGSDELAAAAAANAEQVAPVHFVVPPDFTATAANPTVRFTVTRKQ